MATTYEQHESDEDGDPWKDSKMANHSVNDNQLPPELLDKSMITLSSYHCGLLSSQLFTVPGNAWTSIKSGRLVVECFELGILNIM